MWGKLFLLSVLACAVVSPVLSQSMRDNVTTEWHNITMGQSGQVCTGQGRRCIKEADCINRRCVCPDGKKGKGQIECVNTDEWLCTLFGDPHIHAFGDAQSTINLPCRFRAARFVTDNLNTSRGYCSFEVFATGHLRRGRYVVRSVHIAVAVGNYATQEHHTAHVYKTQDYNVVDDTIYNYLTRIIHRDSIWGSTKPGLGITVLPFFDRVNNFAILEVPDCETRIKYRAFDPRRYKHQKQMPGLSIMTPPHAHFEPGFGDYPNSVCGTPDDPTTLYKDRAEALGLVSHEAALLHDILSDRPDQQDNDMAEKCYEAFDAFALSTAPIDDLNACAHILTEHRVSRCIEENSIAPIESFIACLEDQRGITTHCTRFAKAASRCSHISGWSGPKDIKCPTLAHNTTVSPELEK